MTNTSSTLAVVQAIRTQLYNFQQSGTNSVSSSLGTRLYVNQPPDNVTFPYAVMRLVNQISNTEYRGDRQTASVEIMIYDRPRSNTSRAEGVADNIDGAMTRLRLQDADGIMFGRSRLRDTIPPMTDPADREVVAIRLLYDIAMWPQFLTQYSGSL